MMAIDMAATEPWAQDIMARTPGNLVMTSDRINYLLNKWTLRNTADGPMVMTEWIALADHARRCRIPLKFYLNRRGVTSGALARALLRRAVAPVRLRLWLRRQAHVPAP